MNEENKDENLNNNKDNAGKFNVMPDEFFNIKYQQSRVRKEQQMRAEKEEIDRNKRRQEEKVRRILEKEKIQKERAEARKAEIERREEEKRIIAQKREEEKKKIEEERAIIRAEKEKEEKQKQEQKRMILELRKKAMDEKRGYNKENQAQLREELDRINKLKEEADPSKLTREELKEFNKDIQEQRKAALKKMKEQKRLNRIEQKRIARETKEEEKKKKKEEAEKLKGQYLESQKNLHKKLNFGFVKDLEQRLKPKQTIFQKALVVIYMLFAGCAFVLILAVTIDNTEKFFVKDNKSNISQNNTLPISDNEYGYSNNDNNIVVNNTDTTSTIPDNNQQIDTKEFFKFFFARTSFNMGIDSDGDYLTDKEEPYYNTPLNNKDADGDSYPDGEEVANLYNPKGYTPAKIIDSGLIKIFNDGVTFYYPYNFIVSESPDNKTIDILPEENSDEYFDINFLANSNTDFLSFIKQDLGNEDINLLKLNMQNEAYIDSIGKTVYVKFDNGNILRIKYINNSSLYNYSATFAMLIRSLGINND